MIKSWPLLDEVSVIAYFPINHQNEVKQSWKAFLKPPESFAQQYQRP